MDKHLCNFNLNPMPTGHELDSTCAYFMRHKPEMVSFLHTLYGDHLEFTTIFLAGYAFALSMIEDNGYPVDLDDVLHNWEEGDRVFDLEGAIREFRGE